MSEAITAAVSTGKWGWKAGGTPPPPKKAMDIKVKAAIQAAVMTVVAFLLYHFKHHVYLPVFLCGFAATVLISGLFVPPLFRTIDRFFAVTLARWIGTCLTYLLLVPFYYLIFAPAHWILNARGIDPMARAFPTKQPTYWIPRKPVATAQYKKQH